MIDSVFIPIKRKLEAGSVEEFNYDFAKAIRAFIEKNKIDKRRVALVKLYHIRIDMDKAKDDNWYYSYSAMHLVLTGMYSYYLQKYLGWKVENIFSDDN